MTRALPACPFVSSEVETRRAHHASPTPGPSGSGRSSTPRADSPLPRAHLRSENNQSPHVTPDLIRGPASRSHKPAGHGPLIGGDAFGTGAEPMPMDAGDDRHPTASSRARKAGSRIKSGVTWIGNRRLPCHSGGRTGVFAGVTGAFAVIAPVRLVSPVAATNAAGVRVAGGREGRIGGDRHGTIAPPLQQPDPLHMGVDVTLSEEDSPRGTCPRQGPCERAPLSAPTQEGRQDMSTAPAIRASRPAAAA